MIRLRSEIARWLRHPAVGPILIVLLAVALAFLVLHEVSEGSIESLLTVCATLAALGAVMLLRHLGLPPLVRLRCSDCAGPYESIRLGGAVVARPHPLRL